MEPSIARRMHRPLESVHGVVYLAPEAEAAYTAIDLKRGGMSYFAPRAAALGAAPAQVVAAAFCNFSPSALARSIPLAWERATPAQVVAARFSVADQALRRLLGEEAAAGPAVVEAAAILQAAVAGCPLEGRPLFAGNLSLPWPTQPHLALWHGATVLREFRGDGHIAALVVAGVSGIEALVMHDLSGEAAPNMLPTRGWLPEELEAARARLLGRGWLDDADGLTDAGRAVRESIEDRTDELALAPWETVGTAATERLHDLLTALPLFSAAPAAHAG
jgi:hypothetical protein